MKTSFITKAAAGVATLSLAAFPLLAGAQAPDVGLEYATAIGLGTQDVRETAAGLIRAFMGLLGIIAVVIILMGGFQWMISGGEPEKSKKARQMIISGIIGLVIIFSAYAIAQFIIGAINEGTGT
jgi:Zn-dependent protease with chaperone function